MSSHPSPSRRAGLLVSVLLLVPALAPAVPGVTIGIPQRLAMGVTRTTADVMAHRADPAFATRHTRPEREAEGLERDDLPQAAGARAAASTPRLPTAVIGRAGMTSVTDAATAQSVAMDFEGASYADINDYPPDPDGAVGPSQYVVLVNGRLRTFDKTTGIADGVLDLAPYAFFSPVTTPVQGGIAFNITSDPNIRYDRLTGRWFLTAMDFPCNDASCNSVAPNRILFAVSDAASAGVITPATVWTYFYFQADGTDWIDFPSLGLDANALYVGGDMFTPTYGFVCTNGYVVRKSSLLGAGPIVVTKFASLGDATTEGPWAPRGVDDPDPVSNEGYFIGVSTQSLGRIVLRRVSDPGGTPSLSGNILLTVNATARPQPVPHLGNTGGSNGRLDATDDRVMGSMMRNGRLWVTQTISVDASGVAATTGTTRRDAIRWYELTGIRSGDNGGVPAVVQSGTLFDPAANVSNARQYFIPAITVSGQGHMAMGFSTAGEPYHADAGVVNRLAGDAPGTLRPATLVTASTTSYNPPWDTGWIGSRRWGDFSVTSVDPLDDMTMWTIQQYCDGTDSYGVRVAKLAAPPPATPTSVPAVTTGSASVIVTLTGTSVNGSGFFDPGADLAPPARPFRHLTASITATGVTGAPPTVNHVTYGDPTHVTLDLNTSAATANLAGEKYTVVITDPDGQTASAAVLQVNAGAAGVGPAVAGAFRLESVVPNPTTGATRIAFSLATESRVTVRILDASGREVARLADGTSAAGRHDVSWDGTHGGRRAPAGVYFVRFTAGGTEQVRRLVLER